MKKKITIIIDTMIDGGAHRVACIQANKLSEKGYDITMLFLIEPISYPYYISSKINKVSLLKKQKVSGSNFFNKVKRILLYMPMLFVFFKKNKPDLLISHIHSVNFKSILIAKLFKLKIISCEHTTNILPLGVIRHFHAYIGRHYIYKISDLITVLSNDDKKYYDKFLKNVKLLVNPLPFKPAIYEDLKKEQFILAAGDLNRINIKGWDTLLNVFAFFSKDNDCWNLKIAGGSADSIGLNTLKKIAIDLDIAHKIEFLGSVDDMESLYRRAGIFVVTSRFEGFSMVLVEAMSQGCAVISFDCKSGPSEIISNMKNGILVENQSVDKMLENLQVLTSNNELRQRLSRNAIDASYRYSVDNVIHELECFIHSELEE